MATQSNLTPHIQDLVTRIELASENVALGEREHALALTPYEKQKLLAVTKNLTAKLEGPETATWKVVFGVYASFSDMYFLFGVLMNLQRFGEKGLVQHMLKFVLQTAPSTCLSSVRIQDANL